MDTLVAKLKSLKKKQLPQLKFSEMANQAVKENNAVVVSKGEEEPTKGGNIAKYSELAGAD